MASAKLCPILNPSTAQRFPLVGPLPATFPFTPAVGLEVQVPTASGALTVRVPGAGARFDGAMFAVTDIDGSAAANPITVDGNGTLVDGAATQVAVSVAFESAVYVFDSFDGQWHRLLFARDVTDPVDTNIFAIDLAATLGPSVQISTLYGDGTVGSPNSPQNNPSHILGDVISWEPAAAQNAAVGTLYVKEASINHLTVNNAPTVLSLVPIADLETYAIDMTVTAKRHDGTGVSERWKLSAVVSRDDAGGGGVQYDATQTETDGITTKAGTATVLGLTVDTTGNVLSIIFAGIAGGGNTAEYSGALRLARQKTTS